jgi:hypothetical protein
VRSCRVELVAVTKMTSAVEIIHDAQFAGSIEIRGIRYSPNPSAIGIIFQGQSTACASYGSKRTCCLLPDVE